MFKDKIQGQPDNFHIRGGLAMLIDRQSIHLFRESLSGPDSGYIIYPPSFLSDIFDDFSFSKKTEDRIYELRDKIDSMDEVIGLDAPVSSINGKINDIKLDKSDLKRFDNDQSGLNKVDNTRDIDKLPSVPFKIEWEKMFASTIKKFENMNSLLDIFRKHVSADGGSPTKLNPHRTSLLNSGIYYNNQLIKIDPNTFIRNSIVRDELLAHNQSEYAHPNIQKFIHQSQGTLVIDTNKLSNKYNVLIKKIDTSASNIIDDEIVKHVSDMNSHMIILDTIIRENNRLQTIHVAKENDRYEYVSHKINSIDRNLNYTREYPSIKAINNIISKISKGVSFYDQNITPHIIFDIIKQNITVKCSNGNMKNISVPGYSVNQYHMNLFVDRVAMSFHDINIDNIPIFGILSSPGIIGYKNESDSSWNEYILKLKQKHDPLIISAVRYTNELLSKSEYDKMFPEVSLTGLFFSPDGVFINRKKTFSSSENYKVWSTKSNISLMHMTKRDSLSRDNTEYPKIKEHIEHISTFNHENTISLEEKRVTIGSLQITNMPIKNQSGVILHNSIDINTGTDIYTKNITITAQQQSNERFDIGYKYIIF